MKSLHPLDSTLTEFNKDEVSFNLERYFQTILDNKWRIALFVLTVLVATYLIVNSLTPQYTATATVQIEQKESQVVDVQSLYGLDTQSEEYLSTEFEVLKSRPLAEKVVGRLDLANHEAFQAEEGMTDKIPGLAGLRDRVLGVLGMGADETTDSTVEKELARRELIKDYSKRLMVTPMRKTQLVKRVWKGLKRLPRGWLVR